MPLYRTNSDRGLWKKYRHDQPQHFHKPCYLDYNKPQVTYSQLDLESEQPQQQNGNQSRQSFRSIKRHYKSAPVTPRANSPINSRKMIDGDRFSPPETGTRPLTATSIYSQETTLSTGYPAENASSWDSRSLGRDSALEPYMAHHTNGRYSTDTPDRPNPFIQGSNIATEADNVVQMFLKNINVSRRPPGRIEDLPSPVALTSSDADKTSLDGADRMPINKTVISQLRQDFFQRDFPASYEKPEQLPKTNKYLSSENRWSKQDVVQTFVAPQMHHAEVVHVRQDSTSTEASSTIEGKLDRSFEDPAFTQYQAEHNPSQQQKKKGFLASIFKKTNKKDKQTYKEQQEEVYEDSDEIIEKKYEDFVEEMPKLLPRKRSMSKPTDLDAILKMQEEMEKEQNVEEVFANDPFFQSTLRDYNIDLPPMVPARDPIEPRQIAIVDEPLYENHLPNRSAPSLETTQEIDIDAVLGYTDEKAIENIDWPSQELPAEEESPIELPKQVDIDYSQPPKTKKSFFSFGKKNKKKANKNDEVSYYIEEPQPEPVIEPALNENEPYEAKEVQKSSFFRFKSKDQEYFAPNEEMNESKSHGKSGGLFKFKSSKSEHFEPHEDEAKKPSLFKPSKSEHDNFEPNEDHFEPPPVATKPSFFKSKSPKNPTELNPQQNEDHFEPPPVATKPSFFKSRSPKNPTELNPQQIDDEEPTTQTEESFISEASKPSKSKSPPRNETEEKPSFFKFKAKSNKKKRESFEEPVVTKTDEESGMEEVPPRPPSAELPPLENPPFEENPIENVEEDDHELGPIREEQPSFDKTDANTSVPGPLKKTKKMGGFSSLFKSQNKSSRKSNPQQIGSMAPVDVSHLVEEFDEEEMEAKDKESVASSAPGRSRKRQKSTSSGFDSFFGPAKPRSRPSSQSRQDNFQRGNQRSRSLPRARQSKAGLSDFFNPPQKRPQEAPQDTTQNQKIEPEMVENGPQRQETVRAQPPPKSKSLGGFFKMQPRQQPRRPQTRPPQPPTEVKKSVSQTSIASRSKGLSNFMDASPIRNSKRFPRSQTFPNPREAGVAASVETDVDAITDTQDHTTSQNMDKIELAPEQPQARQDLQPEEPTRRVMGRRSGRFRRSQQNSATPPQLQGPHRMPPPPAAANNTSATEQSLARDIFAESVNRPSRGPSRRGSMTSLNQPKDNHETLPPDSEYDQAVNKVTMNEARKRQQNMRNYNSLPRLGKRNVQNQAQQQQGGDPETRSLGDQKLANRRRPRQGNDNCQMM